MDVKIILHKMSDVAPKCEDEPDSIKYMSSVCNYDERSRGLAVLEEAQMYYMAMERYRENRERNKRYCYGDQWGDMIEVNGEWMKEEKYIMSQGNIPLKTNLIRRLVNNVTGAYLKQSTTPTCVARDREEQRYVEALNALLQYNMQLNRTEEVEIKTIEEFLVGGLVMHRKWAGWLKDADDCWTSYVDPNNIILDNNMRDIRGWDCSFVGEIHDVNFGELCSSFVRVPSDFNRLKDIYGAARSKDVFTSLWNDFGYTSKFDNMDFFVPKDESRCRVIEVWRKENKPRYRCHDYNTGEVYKIDIEDYDIMVARENAKRYEMAVKAGMSPDDIPYIHAEYFIDEYWYYYYLSPMGDILREGETPYEHGEHPYVFKIYPFIDGEIHSFVENVIDQQRYINRLIMLNDWVIRASAKGVLMIPRDTLGDNSPKDFANAWAEFNGVIVYEPSRSGHVPQQVSNNSTNVGIHEMLNLQLKSMEDVSGVQGALQGKPGYSGMAASLYAQQAQNSSTSILGLLESFNGFRREAAYKDVKNIQQFYDEKKIENIAGRSSTTTGIDAKRVKDVEADVNIVQSTTASSVRDAANEMLMMLWQNNAISVKQLLKVGNFPFADELLQSIEAQEEQMKQGQIPEGVSPELMQQAQQGANMNAVNALQNGVAA